MQSKCSINTGQYYYYRFSYRNRTIFIFGQGRSPRNDRVVSEHDFLCSSYSSLLLVTEQAFFPTCFRAFAYTIPFDSKVFLSSLTSSGWILFALLRTIYFFRGNVHGPLILDYLFSLNFSNRNIFVN